MNRLRQTLFPILAALIWGMAFSAQSVCASYGMGFFTVNMYRSIVAFIVLIFVSVIFSKGIKKLIAKLSDKKYIKNLVLGGLCCGGALTVATNLQQAAIEGANSGKVGFITSLYVVLVPILGIVVKKKAPLNVWISICIASVGMFLLCVKDVSSFSISYSDLLAFLCAVMYAVHILCVDHFASNVDGVHLSCIQFLFVSIFSAIPTFIFESPSFEVLVPCIGYILYIGIFSSGVAYTLQILAQKDSNPTVVTLLLSLESVFSVLSGVIFLKESMSLKEYIGCAIMFIAVLLSQLQFGKKNKNI